MSALADHVRLIGLDPVDSVAVLEGVHRDGLYAQLVCRSEGPNSDLTAVGDQHLGEHASNLPRDCYRSETAFIERFLGLRRIWLCKRGDLDSEGHGFQTESDGHLTGDGLGSRLELERGILDSLRHRERTHLGYAAKAGVEIRDLHQISNRGPRSEEHTSELQSRLH